MDFLVLESGDVEHLLVETPEGVVVDRMVSMQTRVMQGIRVGDTVRKKAGFGNRVERVPPDDRSAPRRSAED